METNKRYMLLDSTPRVIEEFSAPNDADAEMYVEDNYSADDGYMRLVEITHVCSWPA